MRPGFIIHPPAAPMSPSAAQAVKSLVNALNGIPSATPGPATLTKMAAGGTAYCTECGSTLRPMFNMAPKCPKGCGAPKADDPRYPLWWSHWAGIPRYIGTAENSTLDDLVRLADAVVVFEMAGSNWDGTAKVKDSEVYVVKNLTWDSTVGKFFKLTERQGKMICRHAESVPDSLKQSAPRHVDHMTCLRRP